MLSKIRSCALEGIDGYPVEVEVDIAQGIPSFVIVGLGDAAINEAKERVRSAIKNTGYKFPVKRITINLAPANVRKEGSSFDLPIAMGLLAATEQIPAGELGEYAFVGELSLGGDLKRVDGVLPMTINLMKSGVKNIMLPAENASEAAVVKGINIIPAHHVSEVIRHLSGEKKIPRFKINIDDIFINGINVHSEDFEDVKGQDSVKRALEVAASGAHNCLMIGSPGSGKTMLARRIPTILPPLTFDESLEVTKIYSSAGLLPAGASLMTVRPFRAPHHSISYASLVGGGRIPKPGEISLSHYGVLFLDELPEFGRNVLEVMRQPLEDGHVTISRVNANLTYPSKTMLVCAANPCRCGYLGDETKPCTCSSAQVQRYLSKLSGPLLDRIDIQIQVKGIKYGELDTPGKAESSKRIKERVVKARAIQYERYRDSGIYTNSQLSPAMIEKYCKLGSPERQLMKNAFEKLGLSARAYNRILKVARTIADMEGSERIRSAHIAEAVQYRSLDRKLWS